MSIIGGSFGVFGAGGFPQFGLGYGQALVTDFQQPPGEDKPAKPLEPTDRPLTWFGGIGGQPQLAGQGMFPGFTAAPWSSPWLYWEMRKYGTLVLAYTITVSPIISGSRTIRIADERGNPKLAEEMKEAAEEDLLPVLASTLPGACECLNFGAWLHEIVWQRVNGRMTPSANSVLPTEAILHCDQQRKFAGFEIGSQFRDPRYAFLAVNQPHIHPVLGYSRMENCRADWWRAIQSNLNADRVERKAAGIQMMIGMPIGDSFSRPGPDGKPVPLMPQDVAQTILNAAVQGNTFSYPLTPFRKEDIVSKPELADIPAIKVHEFDWGDNGPALMAHLARLDYSNTQMMRGYGRPEREAMQGHHGTNAESETQGAIGTLDSEQIHAKIVQQWDQQVMATWRLTNYGPDAPMIETVATPLADPQQTFLQGIVGDMISDRNVGPEFVANINPRELLQRTKVPVVSEKEAAKAVAKQQATANTQQPGNAPPTQQQTNQKPGAMTIAASADEAMPLWRREMRDRMVRIGYSEAEANRRVG